MYRRKSFASSCLTNSLLPQAAVMQMAQVSENTSGLNQLKNRLSGTIDHLDGFGPRASEGGQGPPLRDLCTETLGAKQPIALR
jgi:hypothetical protein